jgi:hypothetical protein
VLAMNQIKDFYVHHVAIPNLEDAFRWKTASIPPQDRTNSLSFYLVLEVGLFGAASFGAAYFFTLLGFGWTSWGPAILLGALFFAGEIVLYRRLLAKPA